MRGVQGIDAVDGFTQIAIRSARSRSSLKRTSVLEDLQTRKSWLGRNCRSPKSASWSGNSCPRLRSCT